MPARPGGRGRRIVEPGGARTNVRYGGSVPAGRIDAHDGTPAAAVRRILAERITHGMAIPPGWPPR
ncbi:hypothetical protein ACQP2F_23130 [Actinoplanes sp. CA-030573]|uniref:hypothetical protein n=1 Tax=Actinoplanes sp. CA-030573 TaxID=3239898 RepID=UPI003D8DB168